ncbi:MAG: cysteine desulfurase, partial [Firmicutes bacterium]|nr:cysteine desulfurase [Bacillota bacterium]
MKALYFDYAASTPLHPEVLKEMLPFLSIHFGNPSSIHSFGRTARAGIEKSRENLASVLDAEPVEIIFTSGGTEADNLAVIGSARALRDTGRHIITSKIEHPAVLRSCQFLEKEGFSVTYLPVDSKGLIDPESLREALRKDTIFISIMHANNEIGVIEPVDELCKIALEAQIPFHSDGVQSFGYIDVNLDNLPVDMYSVSAHKIYGPKGAGALYIKRGTKISSLIYGGEQENQKRAGTENTASIVGMGKAARLSLD